MFESLPYNKPLDEDLFEEWLEKGREQKIGFQYLLVVWNAADEDYHPLYFTERDELMAFQGDQYQEVAVAAYDLYSESRIPLD